MGKTIYKETYGQIENFHLFWYVNLNIKRFKNFEVRSSSGHGAYIYSPLKAQERALADLNDIYSL